jgi:hypothetical protein
MTWLKFSAFQKKQMTKSLIFNFDDSSQRPSNKMVNPSVTEVSKKLTMQTKNVSPINHTTT